MAVKPISSIQVDQKAFKEFTKLLNDHKAHLMQAMQSNLNSSIASALKAETKNAAEAKKKAEEQLKITNPEAFAEQQRLDFLKTRSGLRQRTVDAVARRNLEKQYKGKAGTLHEDGTFEAAKLSPLSRLFSKKVTSGGGGKGGGGGGSVGDFAAGLDKAKGSMNELERASNKIKGHIADTTEKFLKWSGLGAAFTTLLAGGSFFGLHELSGGAAASRQQALTYGLRGGESDAFNLNYRRFVGDNYLGTVNSVQHDETKSWIFDALGIQNSRNMNTGDLAAASIPALKRAFASIGGSRVGADALGLTNLTSYENLQLLSHTSDQEIAAQEANRRSDRGGLYRDENTGRRWQDFDTALDRAGRMIENTFVNASSPLVSGLGGLSTAFSHFLGIAMNSDVVKNSMVWLGEELDKLSDALKDGSVEQNFKDLMDDVKEFGIELLAVGRSLRSGLQAIGVIPADAPPPGTPGLPGGPALPPGELPPTTRGFLPRLWDLGESVRDTIAAPSRWLHGEDLNPHGVPLLPTLVGRSLLNMGAHVMNAFDRPGTHYDPIHGYIPDTPGMPAIPGSDTAHPASALMPGGRPATLGAADPGTAQGRKEQALAFFQSPEGGGWSPAQAAGLVANLLSEGSSLDPRLGGSNGEDSYGIGQWHSDRREDFAHAFHHDIHDSTYAEQLAFVNWELQHTERNAGNLLRGVQTAYDAGDTVSRAYERPRAVEEAARNRGIMAEQITTTNDGAGPTSQQSRSTLNVPTNANVNVGIVITAPPGASVTANAAQSAVPM